ncbi:MAG TPA: putative toxin-antitoxin system toxin component, PIN family [Candidatus Nanoarchaeia archaeon]|nr:putative toxin-antitoxin system toxin component, PIN family [Candidatus Nanoarchaeia archaeon]
MNKDYVVLDTNIYISATFWQGMPYRIVQLALKQEILAFISQDIFNEIRRVLERDFGRSKPEIDRAIDSFALFTHSVEPKDRVSVIKDDPDDDRILECALASGAFCIVSQDNHLLNLKEFRGIKILSPKQFLQSLPTMEGKS